MGGGEGAGGSREAAAAAGDRDSRDIKPTSRATPQVRLNLLFIWILIPQMKGYSYTRRSIKTEEKAKVVASVKNLFHSSRAGRFF